MPDHYKLGIALIPTKEHQQRIYDLVTGVHDEHDLDFACLPGTSIPHLTLFQGCFETEQQVINAVSNIDTTSMPESFDIKAPSIWATKILFLNFKPVLALSDLHTRLFKQVVPHSLGSSADPQDFKDITEGQQKSFKETGYPFSLDEYLPHITLAHLQKKLIDTSDPLSTAKNIMRTTMFPKSISFEKLVVFKVGEKGACTNFVYEHNFGL